MNSLSKTILVAALMISAQGAVATNLTTQIKNAVFSPTTLLATVVALVPVYIVAEEASQKHYGKSAYSLAKQKARGLLFGWVASPSL